MAETTIEQTLEALTAHFMQSGERVKVPNDLVKLTGLDERTACNAARVLNERGLLVARGAWQVDYPILITGVNV
jgi:hypothetical protein